MYLFNRAVNVKAAGAANVWMKRVKKSRSKKQAVPKPSSDGDGDGGMMVELLE